ncbi:hypothetical protein SM124_18025 [Bacillus sp. 31A1R]|uniref:Alkylhydroperoxidase family enzyme, contains CxxC motif n=1 Tax=Robertmurraya mangrovi TaxID=3098077 RepID=A0ABU5J2P0_9BACI|nr:hypothetical protein [Bacillus sp. 31A1R]MDZ5473617.1 hypothetical protein [Bacillus sp. 31A1R]
MARIQLTTEGTTNFEKALNYNPILKKYYDELYEHLWNNTSICKEEKEKVRLYLANKNGCATCMSLSYIENSELNEKITHSMKMGDFTLFSKKEQLLFAFIDKYKHSPREVNSLDIEALNQYYDEKELVELLAIINLFDGFQKIIVSLDLYDFCSL